MPYLNDVMHFQHLIVLLLGRCSFLLRNFIILYKFEYIDWMRFPCSSKNRFFQAAAYCDFENHELNDYRPLLPSTVKMNGCGRLWAYIEKGGHMLEKIPCTFRLNIQAHDRSPDDHTTYDR